MALPKDKTGAQMLEDLFSPENMNRSVASSSIQGIPTYLPYPPDFSHHHNRMVDQDVIDRVLHGADGAVTTGATASSVMHADPDRLAPGEVAIGRYELEDLHASAKKMKALDILHGSKDDSLYKDLKEALDRTELYNQRAKSFMDDIIGVLDSHSALIPDTDEWQDKFENAFEELKAVIKDNKIVFTDIL